jgi:DNA-binding transcriptional MerR regulator
MNIGDLAKATGTTPDTLRHYEKLGLLDAPQRAGNGYRRYAEAHAGRVRFIRGAQSLGFSLAEIGAIVPQLAAGRLGRAQIEASLHRKIEQIDAHMKALRQLKKDLLATFAMLTCERDQPVSVSAATRTAPVAQPPARMLAPAAPRRSRQGRR